jgi:hypothetical protein
MMSLPRRQFNLIGITDPVYRFGNLAGAIRGGTHSYLRRDSREFYFLWRSA